MAPNNKTQTDVCVNCVKVKPMISVLPNDYKLLTNHPKINGVILLGDIKSDELNLLSSKVEDYETISLIDSYESAHLIVLTEGKAAKIALKDLPGASDSSFVTSDKLNTNAPIGSYQFVEKEYK